MQTNSEVRSSASGTGATDYFVAGAKRDGGSSGAGQVLSTLGNRTDGRLQVQFSRMDFDFFVDRDGTKSGGGMPGVSEPQLAALLRDKVRAYRAGEP